VTRRLRGAGGFFALFLRFRVRCRICSSRLGLRFFLASQLFFEVFTSKVEMRRTTLVLLQFGQRIGFTFF
jgi:hypothetical protein